MIFTIQDYWISSTMIMLIDNLVEWFESKLACRYYIWVRMGA